MNIEKIKDWLLQNKKYLVVFLGIILVLFFFFKKNDQGQVDNSNVFNNQTAESQNFSKKNLGTSTSTSSSNNSQESTSQNKTVTCDISGAIKHEGVYTLKNGARLEELINAAGGLKTNAQVKAINRAVLLKDQDKIHIPFKGEKINNATTVTTSSSADSATSSGLPQSSSSASGEKVNLNTASASDLQKLNGIGEKKAEQIIAYRDQNGQFKKIEDLMQVSGIGEKTFAALKDQLEI